MSLDVRNNRVALKPLSEDIKNQPWSMEAAADNLMDDVFAEVDTMLKSGGELKSEPAEPEYVTMQQIPVPRINMPPTMQERPKEAAPPTPEKVEKSGKSGKSFEKLLLVAACTSLGITLLLWLASSGRLNGLFGANAPSTPVAQKTVPPADTQFMDYMQRSLDKFNQQSAAPQPQASPQPAPQVANAQIPVPFPGNVPASSNQPQSVLERVYIPVTPRTQTVYINPTVVQPSPSPQAGAAPRTLPAGANLAARTRASNPAPQPRPAVPAPMSRPEIKTSRPAVPVQAPVPMALGIKLGPPLPQHMVTARSAIPNPVPRSAVAFRPAPSPSPRQTVGARPAPAPSPSPQPTVAARPAPAPSPSPRQRARREALPAAPSTNTATAPSVQTTPRAESTQAAAPQNAIRHVLRGVLKSEDGSKDAALFEVNGVTRRVTVGESISSSGWTLVEITNQEAVIRRNGEVRSIYAGQDF